MGVLAGKQMEHGALFGKFSAFNWVSAVILTLFAFSAFAKPIKMDVFLTSTCPRCIEAHDFTKKLHLSDPTVAIHIHWINEDKSALNLFYTQLLQFNNNDFTVPAFFFCGTHWIGFSPIIEQNLIKSIRYCQTHPLNVSTSKTIQAWADGAYRYSLLPTHLPNLLFTPFIALMDAFNPCALFYLAAFTAFLWLQPHRKERVYIGAMWIISLSLTHLSQTLFPLFMQHIYVYSYPLVSGLVGLALIGLAWSFARARTIPFYVIAGISALSSFFIQLYQQTCPSNVNFIFQTWLASKPLLLTRLTALFIYESLYLIAPLLLLMFILRSSLVSRFKHDTALFILLLTGLTILLCPSSLSHFNFSCYLLILAFVLGWLFNRIIKARFHDHL